MDFRVEPDHCVTCLACVRVCPADAVAVDSDRVRIVDEACTRCGLCLPACPHGAIVAFGDYERALELAAGGKATLILSVESAAHFHPATPEQVVNACYQAGFRTVHRGVLGDELVAREYLRLFAEPGWGTLIRSTCPVVVEQIRTEHPELVPYLAPVDTPIAAEAKYLKAMYGKDLKVVYAGVCLTEGGSAVDAAVTFADLGKLLEARGIKVEDQLPHFERLPEERRRHWSTSGGMPLELLAEQTHASRRFKKVRGLSQLDAMARAVSVDRIDLGFVDILPCDGCLDHPLLGSKEQLYWRRAVVEATEPPRSKLPVLDEEVVRRVNVGATFAVQGRTTAVAPDEIEDILAEIGNAPNGRAWDCGACGYRSCREFAGAMVKGRTTYKSCPPYLEKQAKAAQQQAAADGLTGLATFRVLRDRLSNEVARTKRSGEAFAVLFIDLDHFKQVNDQFGHEAGNEVLKGAAREVLAAIRTADFAARYGGDEFVVILVRTGLSGAVGVAEKMRERMLALGAELGYPKGFIGASIGVAEFRLDGAEHEDVLVAADRALYRAKAGGRNQVATGA